MLALECLSEWNDTRGLRTLGHAQGLGAATYIKEVDEGIADAMMVSMKSQSWEGALRTCSCLRNLTGVSTSVMREDKEGRLTNAEVHEVIVAKNVLINALLELGLSDTVGNVA